MTNRNADMVRAEVSQRDGSLPVLVVAALAVLLGLVLLSGCASGSGSGSGSAQGGDAPAASSAQTPAPVPAPVPAPGDAKTPAAADAKVLKAGDSLVIPVKDITGEAKFYPVVVGGTDMEIIAVKAPDGTMRTAFNTCQVCYDSGRGYYEQVGSNLVCQNCGNRFAMDRVEVESGGCNPWPIFAKDKTVTSKSIKISYDFLSKSKDVFANWKTLY